MLLLLLLLYFFFFLESEVTLRKFAKPCTRKPEPEEEQDEDHPSIHLEKTAIADGFTKVLPQGIFFFFFFFFKLLLLLLLLLFHSLTL